MYSYKDRVTYSQVDSKGQMTFTAMVNAFQDCCTLQTHDVGYSLDWLIENQLGWYLTSYQANVYGYLKHADYYVVNTYPVKIKGFMGWRLFDIRNDKDEILCDAYSEWVFMDRKKGGPARASKEMIDAYDIKELPMDKWGDRKIFLPENRETITKFNVDSIYLDTNGHMNNAYYIETAFNAIGERDFGFIKVEFKNSAMKDDSVLIKDAVVDNVEFVSLEDEKGKVYCQIELHIKK